MRSHSTNSPRLKIGTRADFGPFLTGSLPLAIASMTAYGFGECLTDQYSYVCETRSLNSRFIEVNVRLPRYLIALEPEIHKWVKSNLSRGKVDVFIDMQSTNSEAKLPDLAEGVVDHYLTLFSRIQELAEQKQIGTQSEFRPETLIALEGVLQDKQRIRGQQAEDLHKEGIFKALKMSVARLQKGRNQEGATLNLALQELLKELTAECHQVRQKRGEILQQIKANFKERVLKSAAALGDAVEISEDRLMAEIVILADKTDIEEEVTRLASHIQEFGKILEQGGSIGRKLDFLCQELYREINTVSNKLVQTEISRHSLNLKQTVERLRQQVQNIE
jgi:uncharacterized protein (TIGR00255 family)